MKISALKVASVALSLIPVAGATPQFFTQGAANAAPPAVVAFPMDLLEAEGPLGSHEFAPRTMELVGLMDHAALSMPGVPLPSGDTVVLELERASFNFDSIGVHVDGQPAEWDAGDLTLWRGSVAGDPFSDVFIGFSSLGSYGWIATEGDTFHVSAFAGAGNDWSAPGCRMWSESASADVRQRSEQPLCLSDGLKANFDRPVLNGAPGANFRSGAAGVLKEGKIAVETDFQLFQVFGSLGALQNYTGMLLGAISNRYETEVDVVLTFPYLMYHTNSNDGWTAADGGGNSIDVLNEFRAAWQGNIPAGAHLAHFISGASLGGGVAYLDVLCNQDFGFGVSGNIAGSVNFPVSQGSGNWDFMVIAHELGHNFASPHTHNFCPPLDECAPNGYFGQCQTQQACTSQGTIMSYCHLCSGGITNITTFFHPTVQQTIRDAVAASCLPDYTGDCAVDALEDNDSCAAAVAMLGGTTQNLTVAKVDSDFYSITVPAGATLDVDIFFAHAQADVDIFLYDPTVSCGDTTTYLERSITATDNEDLAYTNAGLFAKTVTLEVQVYPTGTGECADYTIVIDPGQGNTVGMNYCGPAATNSVNESGTMVALGSASVSNNDLTLVGTLLPPGSLGYFVVSENAGFIANPGGSTGNLCLLPPFGRYSQFTAAVAANGTMTLPIDLGNVPQPTSAVAIQPGETWHFQLWHRDSFLGTATSNFTDGIAVTFQ